MIIDKTPAQQTAHQLAIELFAAVQRDEFRHPQLSLHKLNGRTYLGWLEDRGDLSKPESERTWIFPEIYTYVDPRIRYLPLTHEQATKFIQFYDSL